MNVIRVRTNRFTMFYSAGNEAVVTNLSDNEQFFCKKGSIVIVGRNVRVSFTTNELHGSILKNFVFFDYKQIIRLKDILNLMHYTGNTKLTDFSHSLPEAKKIMCFEADKRMKDAFMEIVKADSIYNRIMSFMCFCKVSGIEKRIFDVILFSATSTFCSKVIDLIESNLSKKWTLRIVADEFHLSEVAIRKKLESEGVCFRELLLEIRMKKAMSLLIEGQLSVSKISTSIGYHNTSYFISYFKNFFGMTPKQLQSLLKK
ncbi:AraC family transcriptional regulator [Escherichia coli]|uniref:helix-turn-helix transcriptional regulator n=1 Tax=Escherichia coli TaxID=562 RepID=UPI0029BF48EC|nr:helix-turn-helix transcriptional regulator [Escherichia coli]